jgi:putative SOS response-associated peptidase YedK
MCNFIETDYSISDLEKEFDVAFKADKNSLRSKIAIYDKVYVPIISKDNPGKVMPAYWGIPIQIDYRSKQSKMQYSYNSRIETLRDLKTFKDFADNLCIVPVSGFYEFQHKFLFSKDVSMLHRLKYKDRDIFGLLGIYGDYLSDNKKQVRAFSLITTRGNDLMSKIHNKIENDPRMPISLLPEMKKEIFQSAAEDYQYFNPNLIAQNLEPEKDQPTLF